MTIVGVYPPPKEKTSDTTPVPPHSGKIIVRKKDGTQVHLISDPDAQPMSPPDTSSLIKIMQKVGKPSNCMTFLFVNEGGEPFNIRAKCDVPKYETAAIQAMSTVKYIPITYNGKPAMRKDVSYPFELLFE